MIACVPVSVTRFLVVVLILVVVLATACGESRAPDSVSLQLNWYHQAEFVGYYVAEAKGFYDSRGLDVTILEGGPGKGGRKQVVEGTATFASTTFSVNRDAIKNHQPITAVMAVFQIPPLVIFSLDRSNIEGPAELVGKRVGVATDYHRSVLRETLKAAGEDPTAVIEVEVASDLQPLYDGAVDAWVGYASDEPIRAQLAGHPVRSIFPAEYGIGGYEGLLITLESTVTQRPDMVRRFVEATYEGWRYALEHPGEAAQILLAWAPNNDLEFHKSAVRALTPLVDVPQVPFGWIDDARWRQLLGEDFDPQQVGYTMEFSPVTP
jgi:ABC-type nitrate/sulfonate/bicarbonate transport system substrate-binding protein